MPVIARIDWIHRQLQYGRVLHIVMSQGADIDKVKVKIVLHAPDSGTTSVFVREHLMNQLSYVRYLASNNVATDRGHKHSNGVSEVAIWVGQPPSLDSAARLCAPAQSSSLFGDKGGDTVEGISSPELSASAAPDLSLENDPDALKHPVEVAIHKARCVVEPIVRTSMLEALQTMGVSQDEILPNRADWSTMYWSSLRARTRMLASQILETSIDEQQIDLLIPIDEAVTDEIVSAMRQLLPQARDTSSSPTSSSARPFHLAPLTARGMAQSRKKKARKR